MQLTELLYRVLEAIDGRRDLAAVAEHVGASVGRRASADDVAFLVREKLAPLGVLKNDDGSDPELPKVNPLLALRLRFVISDERLTRRLTTPFAALFWPPIVVAVVVAFVAATVWVLFVEGVGGGAREALYRPELLLLTLVLTAASAGFHEFGHAAACRYGGATPGAMGAGLYLVWPAFYTDVTDSYRLDRRGRLRTDLGGLYFNAVFVVATVGAWELTGWDALLVLIPLQLLQMVHQLLPFVRLDGYHILADVTGVPDLFSRIRPTLTGLLPGRSADRRAQALKPWARAVVTTWVVAVVPLLAFALVVAVISFPRIAATAWDSAALQLDALGEARDDGSWLAVIARALSVVLLALPVASTVYLLSRLVIRAGRAVTSRIPAVPGGRPIAAGALVAALAGAAWLMWPNGEYRPIQPGERATVQDSVRTLRAIPGGRPALTDERARELEGAPFRNEAPTPSTTQPTASTTTTTVPTSTTVADDETVTSTTRESTTTTSDSTTTTFGSPSTTGTTVP